MDLGTEREFSEISIDMVLKPRSNEKKSNKIFIVPMCAKICKQQFYVGISSQDYPFGVRTTNNFQRAPHPGYAFTQFGCESESILKPSKGSDILVSNHEGPLSGLRGPAEFVAGHYTYSLKAGKSLINDKGVEGFWVEFKVNNNTTKHCYELGSIFFQGSKPTISTQLYSFVELVCAWDECHKKWYDEADRPYLEAVPDCSVYIGNFQVDSKRVQAEQIDQYCHPNKPSMCKTNALSTSHSCHKNLLPKSVVYADTIHIDVSNSFRNSNEKKESVIFYQSK